MESFRKFPLQQVALLVRQNCYNNVCGLVTRYVINNELFFQKKRKTEETTKITTSYSPPNKTRLMFNDLCLTTPYYNSFKLSLQFWIKKAPVKKLNVYVPLH